MNLLTLNQTSSKLQPFISGGKIEFSSITPDAVDIHTRHKLVSNLMYSTTNTALWEDALPCTQTTMVAINDIDGVNNVIVQKYSFRVSKAVTYTWDEILPKIVLMMSKYLPAVYS